MFSRDPVTDRRRRVLARWLRRTARRVPATDPLRRTHELLLYDRVAEVRSELNEIADMLDRFDGPDPTAATMLHDLLADGSQSPLYNPAVHVSELRATLYYARSRLATQESASESRAPTPSWGRIPRAP
jgi:hypothetical protein